METQPRWCSAHGKHQDHFCRTCRLFYCNECHHRHRKHDKETLREDDLQQNEKSQKIVSEGLKTLRCNVEMLGHHHEDIMESVRQLELLFERRLELQYTTPHGKIRISSWNTQNVKKHLARDCIKRTIHEANLDIVAFQEIGREGKTMKKVLELLQDKDRTWTSLPNEAHPSLGFIWKNPMFVLQFITSLCLHVMYLHINPYL